MKIIQKGFNYSQDGPGNRLVYHLQGCNMRCPWCANPEGLSLNGTEMIVQQQKTVGAGNVVREKRKNSCQEFSVEEILEEVHRSRMLFFEGGGVTFTGGEPTMQFQELKEIMKRLWEEKISVAMENNGTCRKLPELLEYIDYLIMDFKHPDSKIHQEITGMPNEQICRNLEYVLQSGRQLALRIPLIHGFNDTDRALEGFLAFFSSQDMRHCTLEILPYHEYGKEKWKECGLAYKVTDGFVDEKRVKEMERAFREAGIDVVHT